MGIFFMILSCVYAGLIIVSALIKSEFKTCKILFVLGGISLLISNAGIVINNILYILCVITGAILINTAAIINGYKLFGKPHWKHHIIRAIFSIALIFIFIFNFIL